MKKILLLAIGLPLLAACSTPPEPTPAVATQFEDDGCVENSTHPVGFHETNAADTQLANRLFASNGINSSNFRYWGYQQDTLRTQYPPYAKIYEQVVKLHEYANGLLVFTTSLNYVFQKGVFQFRMGEPTAGTSISPTPGLRLGQVRGLFLGAAEEFEHGSATWRPACLSAELGYYDVKVGDTAPERLVLTWRISPRGREYPRAYFEDRTGALISYDNGYRSFTR